MFLGQYLEQQLNFTRRLVGIQLIIAPSDPPKPILVHNWWIDFTDKWFKKSEMLSLNERNEALSYFHNEYDDVLNSHYPVIEKEKSADCIISLLTRQRLAVINHDKTIESALKWLLLFEEIYLSHFNMVNIRQKAFFIDDVLTHSIAGCHLPLQIILSIENAHILKLLPYVNFITGTLIKFLNIRMQMLEWAHSPDDQSLDFSDFGIKDSAKQNGFQTFLSETITWSCDMAKIWLTLGALENAKLLSRTVKAYLDHFKSFGPLWKHRVTEPVFISTMESMCNVHEVLEHELNGSDPEALATRLQSNWTRLAPEESIPQASTDPSTSHKHSPSPKSNHGDLKRVLRHLAHISKNNKKSLQNEKNKLREAENRALKEKSEEEKRLRLELEAIVEETRMNELFSARAPKKKTSRARQNLLRARELSAAPTSSSTVTEPDITTLEEELQTKCVISAPSTEHIILPVVPQSDAQYQLKYAQIPLSSEVSGLLTNINQKGAKAYLVGGSVRDILTGRPSVSDFDIVADCSELDLQRALGYPIAKSPKVQHVNLYKHGYFDIILREPGFSLYHDALTRDFTVNALYADAQGFLYDPLKIINDFNRGHPIRAIGGYPLNKFKDDPIRILRAIDLSNKSRRPLSESIIKSIPYTISGLLQLNLGHLKFHIRKLLVNTDFPEISAANLIDLWKYQIFEAIGTNTEMQHWLKNEFNVQVGQGQIMHVPAITHMYLQKDMQQAPATPSCSSEAPSQSRKKRT